MIHPSSDPWVNFFSLTKLETFVKKYLKCHFPTYLYFVPNMPNKPKIYTVIQVHKFWIPILLPPPCRNNNLVKDHLLPCRRKQYCFQKIIKHLHLVTWSTRLQWSRRSQYHQEGSPESDNERTRPLTRGLEEKESLEQQRRRYFHGGLLKNLLVMRVRSEDGDIILVKRMRNYSEERGEDLEANMIALEKVVKGFHFRLRIPCPSPSFSRRLHSTPLPKKKK